MTSKKHIFLIIGVAVLGALLISQFPIAPSIAFILGIITCAIICSLSFAPTSSASSVKETKSDNRKTLYVGNLPFKASEKDVEELFAKHGKVFEVRLLRDKRTGKKKGFGFVEIDEQSADAMISALNEFDFHTRRLKVRLANAPRQDG